MRSRTSGSSRASVDVARLATSRRRDRRRRRRRRGPPRGGRGRVRRARARDARAAAPHGDDVRLEPRGRRRGRPGDVARGRRGASTGSRAARRCARGSSASRRTSRAPAAAARGAAGRSRRSAGRHHDPRRQDARHRRDHGQRGVRRQSAAAEAGRGRPRVLLRVPMNAKGLRILSRKSYEAARRLGVRQSALLALRRERRAASTSMT